jgi:aminoglycoside phosphotransferase (APT) family kinase protein
VCRVIFPFVDAGHPFHGCVVRLRDELAASARAPMPGRSLVSSEIRGRRLPDGGFTLDRFYTSAQHWSSDGQFAATTLYATPMESASRWYHFPDEPRLPNVAVYLRGRGFDQPGSTMEVLRYVPLRRFTFRSPRRDGSAGDEVGKFKRRSKLEESYQRIVVIAAAVEQAAPGFGVPRPAGVDDDHAIYFQDSVDGGDLATEAQVADDALETAAHVLAGLHAVAPPSLPVLDEAVFIGALDRDLEWIAFNSPMLDELIAHARRVLADPPPIEATVLAHGDFVPSHVLRDGDRLTMIDLDLAHVGDRYRDLAIMLASLPTDVPTVRPDVAAIVTAYESRAGLRLDRRRLAWHRLAAEIYYLALAFSKDRTIDPARVAAAVDDLDSSDLVR